MCTRNISTMDLLVSLVGYMYLGGNTCRLVSFVGISVGYMNLVGNRLWIV